MPVKGGLEEAIYSDMWTHKYVR